MALRNPPTKYSVLCVILSTTDEYGILIGCANN